MAFQTLSPSALKPGLSRAAVAHDRSLNGSAEASAALNLSFIGSRGVHGSQLSLRLSSHASTQSVADRRAQAGHLTVCASAVHDTLPPFESVAITLTEPAYPASPRTSNDDAARSPHDWLKSVAPEIVRHVEEAPLFHLIYEDGGPSITTSRTRVDDETVNDPDSWPKLRGSLCNTNPDAVILVHKLSEDELTKRYGETLEGHLDSSLEKRLPGVCSSGGTTGNTGHWGLVVLGRKSKRHACYILQTTRVPGLSGAATHFSFTRAKCFGPSLHQQLEQAWLA